MKSSPHPPLSVLDEGLAGSALPLQFSTEHRQVYDLIRGWQLDARAAEVRGEFDLYRAEIVDAAGTLWPVAFRTGGQLPAGIADRLPPAISTEAHSQVWELHAKPGPEVPESPARWTTPIEVELRSAVHRPYCGAYQDSSLRREEWLPLSDLLMRCAADDAVGAHHVAEALGTLAQRGEIQHLHHGGRYYVRLSTATAAIMSNVSPPPTLADIAAARQRFEKAAPGHLAAAVAEEAGRFGIDGADPAILSWLDQLQVEGEPASAAYARAGALLPADNLWAWEPLPPASDPAVGRPASERAAVLEVLDRLLAGSTEDEQRMWGEADPLQRLDRRLEAAAALLGVTRPVLEGLLRYNLLARWLLDWPLNLAPIQNGMGPMPAKALQAEPLQQVAQLLRTALRLV